MKLQHIARGAPLLLIGLLLLMSSPACRKGPKVDGRVLEYGTDKPIENATVILSECESASSGDVNCFEVGRTTTSSDGSFGFDKEGFTVGAEAPRYWASGDDYQVISGDGKPIDLHLYPYAWLKVVLKNESGAYRISAPGLNYTSTSRFFYLNQGEEQVITILREGNKDYKYIFGILDEPNHVLTDISNISINNLRTNTTIPIQGLSPFSFDVYLMGLDTTEVLLTY